MTSVDYTRLGNRCQGKFTQMRSRAESPANHPQVQRILEVSGLPNVHRMCRTYDFSHETLRRAVKAGGSLPDWWLDRVAQRTHCRLAYLQVGALPRFEDENPDTREILRLFESDLSAQGRAVVLRLARVVMWVLPEARMAVAMVEAAAEQSRRPLGEKS